MRKTETTPKIGHFETRFIQISAQWNLFVSKIHWQKQAKTKQKMGKNTQNYLKSAYNYVKMRKTTQNYAIMRKTTQKYA